MRPAIWEVGADWPNEGEIDVVEGVNDWTPNQSTLHTSSRCTMPASRAQTGVSTGNTCDTITTNNTDCSVNAPSANSYGPSFNSAGGGWYAMERTMSFIRVWFWSRNDGSVPSDVANGATTIDTDNWGTPYAYFPSESCDLSSHFGEHNIIINLDLCGVWAGAVFNADGCPGDCVTYVNDNPSSFTNAYFGIQWLKIYG
ncbi:putative glycosidase C21B10.07 [Grifola frondosa]|uniref:Putative glycosidase C21B10.07 n=1 Tax=Grifola frondosa TaxID=5627 RepID=A0A1C7M7Y6_GRIFR|nr:putative glycosidase C21B10.07 [Grifola frondosa]